MTDLDSQAQAEVASLRNLVAMVAVELEAIADEAVRPQVVSRLRCLAKTLRQVVPNE